MKRKNGPTRSSPSASAVLGLGAFGALYVVFFLVMILKPGLIFSMMPENITTRALSDGSRIEREPWKGKERSG